METPHNFILVDDDPTHNILCKAIVKKIFPEADVKVFFSPEKTLEYISGMFEHSDLTNDCETIIFLDINMPTMTGWDFLDVFKNFRSELKRKFKIYMLSSSVDNNDLARAEKSALIEQYLQKPLRKDFLTTLFCKAA